MTGADERFALGGLPGDAQQRQQPCQALADEKPRGEHRQVKIKRLIEDSRKNYCNAQNYFTNEANVSLRFVFSKLQANLKPKPTLKP